MAPFSGESNQHTLLVNALTSLTAPLFALLFTDTTATLDFGAVVNAAMTDPTELKYITATTGKDYWSSTITQVRTRDTSGNLISTHDADDNPVSG